MWSRVGWQDADYADFNTVLAALRQRLVDALAQRPRSFREFKRLIAAGSDQSDTSSSCFNAPSSRASSIASSDHHPGGAESGGLDPETLRRTVAEAMGTLPKHLDGLRNGLRGASAALSASLHPPGAATPPP